MAALLSVGIRSFGVLSFRDDPKLSLCALRVAKLVWKNLYFVT